MLLSKKLIARRGLALAAAIGLMSQVALAEEAPATEDQVAVKVPALSAEQIEADTRAYIEALNRRLAEDLAESLKFNEADRLDLASAELAAQG